MKISTDGNYYEIKTVPEIQPITLNVQLGQWSTIQCLYDSGCTGKSCVVIPQRLLEELKLDLPVIGNQERTLMDGTAVKEQLVLVNIRFNQIPSGRPVVIEGLIASVSKDVAFPVVNLGSYCNVFIKAGELALLELNTKGLGRHS